MKIESLNHKLKLLPTLSSKGLVAIDEEVKSLHKNDTWELVTYLEAKEL